MCFSGEMLPGQQFSRLCILVLSIASFTLLTIVYYKDQTLSMLARSKENAWLKAIFTQRGDKTVNCGGNTYALETLTYPLRGSLVNANGDILTRICLFNAALERLRMEELDNLDTSNWDNDTGWTISLPDQIHSLYEWNYNFLQALANYSQIRTVILPWKQLVPNENWSSLNDSTNLLIQNYYVSTASDPLCTWIETPGKVNYAFDMINNWTCNRNIRRALVPSSVTFLALNAKPPYKNYYLPLAFPRHFHTNPPPFVFHLHMIRHGIINKVGDVFSGNVKIVPYGCFPILDLNPPKNNVQNITFREEILVIAQNHGDEMYHRMSEVLPRLALFVDFLRLNPSIAVFSLESKGHLVELLALLGIGRERIVTGVCRARLIYLPRASMCCLPNFIETQVLSKHFRDYIHQHFPRQPRDKVVVIQRSHYRRFRYQDAIERVVEAAARTFNLSFAVYRDKPSPSLNDTMVMFNSALVVIGPHGAGLANVIFSEPGTLVIEGVCNLPHANLFFQRTSLVQGHRWHGVPATDGCVGGVFGVVGVSPAAINSTLFQYLQLLL